MAAITASSTNMNSLDSNPQPSSSGSSPNSPSSSFQTQQAGPSNSRSFMNLNTPPSRGQTFPNTPTSSLPTNPLETPMGYTFAEYLHTWTDAHVARWLAEIKCINQSNVFKTNDIRGDVLLELDQDTLKEMGVSSIGDRLRIINAVKKMRQKVTAEKAPPMGVTSPPQVLLNGGYRPGDNGGNRHFKSSSTDSSISARTRRLDLGRPAPLQLNSNTRNDLPRIVRDGPDPRSNQGNRGSPPRGHTPTGSRETNNLPGQSRSGLPPMLPVPRIQAPPAPGSRTPIRNLQIGGSPLNGRRTPTGDVPVYATQPLPAAPQNQLLTPNTATPTRSGYGLPSDPRSGNATSKPGIRSVAPLQPVPRTSSRPTPIIGAHGRNLSTSSIEPSNAPAPQKLPPRPSTTSTSGHPYQTAASLQPPSSSHTNLLSPIAESFTSNSSPPSYNASVMASGLPAPSTVASGYSVGRGAFNRNANLSYHATAPSLDDLRRKLVKFVLADEGHSCTINVADCAGGIEVLEKVLKKFGKGAVRGSDTDSIMSHAHTHAGGLIVDGWGVYIDWGQGEGEPLTEAELMAFCHASPDNPVREHGLTLRRTGKAKRSKALAQIFGETPPIPGQRNPSPTTPPIVGPKLFTGEDDDDEALLTPSRSKGFEDSQGTSKKTKRASAISILSGLGVRDPETTLAVPLSPTAQKASNTDKKPSKLRNFFGQRPPSELITTHLTEYFPFTEKKVLERTARHSVRRASAVPSKRESKRYSTASWNPNPAMASRFSNSTQGSPTRTSFSSVAPPVPDKSSLYAPDADYIPRMSLSTEDGRSVELTGDNLEESHPSDTPQHLPPIVFPTRSLSDSVESLAAITGDIRPRRVSKAMSIASKRMSYISELRSKRDRTDTASLMTVDEITANVESRRKSFAVGAGGDQGSDSAEEWTNIESEDGNMGIQSLEGTISPDEATEASDVGEEDEEEDEEEEDEDEDEDEELDDEEETLLDDIEPGKSVTRSGVKWIKGALIGAGSFGKVYLGMDASNGLLMAVKQVELPKGSLPNQERKKSMLSALEREIELLKELQHDNIVQYLYSSLDDDFLNIFLEYVPGGSVTALLRNYGAFEEPLVKNFVRQILQGLAYLHDRDIIHRDIKGANILVDNKGGVKISDFGISKKVEDSLMGSNRAHRPSLQGSVFWMAPEVVKQTSHTKTADIWSVGCLVVEMLTGEHPWAQLSQMQAIFKIGSSAKPTIPSDISADAQDFLTKTFDLDYEARPSAGELLLHPWTAPPSKVALPSAKISSTKSSPIIDVKA